MNSKRFAAALLVLTSVVAGAPAVAETYTYPGRHGDLFSVDLPAGWKVEIDGELLHSAPADESIYLGMWAVPYGSMDEAAGALDEIVGAVVRGFEISEEDQFTLHGMPFYYLYGSGRDIEDGSPVRASVALFSPDGETFCILIYFGSPEAEKRHEKALQGIVESIRGP